MDERGYIILGPQTLVFLMGTALSFIAALPIAIEFPPESAEEQRYTGSVYVGGSVGGTLRTLSSSEAQFQSQGVIDEDKDGTGEYGLLSDLAGAPLRNGNPPVNPPFVSSFFARTNQHGFVAKGGFYYRSYVSKDPDVAENKFVILAWPIQRGVSGRNTYLLDQSGEIYAWVRGDWGFSGTDAPKLEDVFWGEPWTTPINEYNWKNAEY